MKTFVKSLIIYLIFPLAILARDNPNWNATFSITPYPSPYTSDWEHNPASVGQLIIFNNSSTSENITVSSTVTKNGSGEVFECTSDQIFVPARSSVTANNTQLIRFGNAHFPNPTLQDQTIRSGRLPEGDYEMCETIRDMSGSVLISNKCADFTILYPDPPSLIYPDNENNITNLYPTFQWTPVNVPPSYTIYYSIKIAQVLEGQTPQRALQANTVQFRRDNLSTSNLTYPIDALTFEPGKTYAWQISTVDQNGFPPTQNEGRSEIFTFTYNRQGTAGEITLTNSYPADNDTIPWVPPHLIVQFQPYDDNITQMDYTLHISGTDGSSYTAHRVLHWPHGPRLGQGWPDASYNERSTYIITDQNRGEAGSGPMPSNWAGQLKHGVTYTWYAGATFQRNEHHVTVNSNSTIFTIGATSPRLVAPENGSTIPMSAQPVTLSWKNQSPAHLNPPDLLGITSSHSSMFFGISTERWKLEFSHDRTFSVIDNNFSGTIPDYHTGETAAELYKTRGSILQHLDAGTYYWRVKWLAPDGTSYLTGPTWSFRLGNADTSCITLSPASPENGGNWTAGLKPRFSVRSDAGLNHSAISGGRLEIWRINNPSQSHEDIKAEAPVYDHTYTGNNLIHFRSPETDNSIVFDLNFVNTPSGESQFSGENGVTYLWNFTLDFNGRTIRSDGTVCPESRSISSDGTFKVGGEETAEGGCSNGCESPEPTDRNPSTHSFHAGDVLKVGKFNVALSSVTGSGSSLTGEGTVSVPFFNSHIRVKFNGIKVNAENEVYEGEIESKIDETSPVLVDSILNMDSSGTLSESSLEQIHNLASQGSRLISALNPQDTVNLPIGLDDQIGGRRWVIAIMGVKFSPTEANLKAGISVDFPEMGPDMGIGLEGEVCFDQNGLGSDASLALGEDIGYDNEDTYSFKFLAPTERDSGTFVSWDCHGFKELRIKAEVEFPRTWLLPDSDDGTSRVKAEFVARVRSGHGWLASASLSPARFACAPGFGLQVSDMTFDFSDDVNPEGMEFPHNYHNPALESDDPSHPSSETHWKGFYIRSASITFPTQIKKFNGQKISVGVRNFIIDGTGLTGDIFATSNILQYPQGNFGGWGASIDTVGISFLNGSLVSGFMDGRIKLPISDSALVYTATLSTLPSGGTGFEFTIVPGDTINAPLWDIAKLSLDPTSSIYIGNTRNRHHNFEASATLNGSLTLTGKVGNLPVNFKGVEFQDFTVSSNSPYVSPGHWSLASEQHSMSGFPISLNSIGIVSKTRGGILPDIGLKFDVGLNLEEGKISGSTTLSIWGKISGGGSGAPQSFTFDGIDLDTVSIHADISAAKIDGTLIFYNSDPTYGNGFKGIISANILHQIQVDVTAQFGSVNNFRYWYIDARAELAEGIAVGPVAFYGFGGGAWYHMSKQNNLNTSQSPASYRNTTPDTTTGHTNSGLSLVPDKNNALGLKALVTIGTAGNSKAFNADVTLEASFLSNGGIGRISLEGQGYMLTGVTSPDRDSVHAKIYVEASLTYDFPNETFDGRFGFNINYRPVFYGNGTMAMHFSPDLWYIEIGKSMPVSDRVNLNLLNLARINGYMMIGEDLPGIPPLPSDVSNLTGHFPTNRNPQIQNGDGFAFGIEAQLGDNSKKHYSFFYANIYADLGFDLALMHYNNVSCSSGPMGINGWYASGQLYAYLHGEMGIHADILFAHGDFKIFDFELAAVLQGGAPNPTWIHGSVTGRYNILNGLIKGSAHFEFTYGHQCTPPLINPLENQNIISDIKPDKGNNNINVFIEPQAAINYTINRPFTIVQTNTEGDSVVRTFRIKIKDFTLKETSSHQGVPGVWNLESNQDQATFYPSEMLKGHTHYTASITAYGEELISGRWRETKDENGHVIQQTVTTTFTTGNAPDKIVPDNVAYSYPLNRQRFFLQDEYRNGVIRLKVNQSSLFNPRTGYNVSFFVRFLALTNGVPTDTTEEPLSHSGLLLRFHIPRLKNSTIYAIQIVRKETRTASSGSGYQLSGSARNYINNSGRLSNTGISQNILALTTLRQSFNIAGSVTKIYQRTLPGLQVKKGEKLLYVYYFKTSIYNNLSQKLADLSFKSTSRFVPLLGEVLTAGFTTSESFDTYDVNGLSYTVPGYANGSSVRHEKIGPLVIVTAQARNNAWQRQFVNPWVYNRINRMKNLSIGWIRNWRSFSPTIFGRLRQQSELAEFSGNYRPSPLLSDDEIMPAAPSSASSNNNITRVTSSAYMQFTGTYSTYFGPPAVEINYNQGMAVPGDLLNAKTAAARLLSGYIRNLNTSEINSLRSLLTKTYVRIYHGRYPLVFEYGYGFTGWGTNPNTVTKYFNY